MNPKLGTRKWLRRVRQLAKRPGRLKSEAAQQEQPAPHVRSLQRIGGPQEHRSERILHVGTKAKHEGGFQKSWLIQSFCSKGIPDLQ